MKLKSTVPVISVIMPYFFEVPKKKLGVDAVYGAVSKKKAASYTLKDQDSKPNREKAKDYLVCPGVLFTCTISCKPNDLLMYRDKVQSSRV